MLIPPSSPHTKVPEMGPVEALWGAFGVSLAGVAGIPSQKKDDTPTPVQSLVWPFLDDELSETPVFLAFSNVDMIS